MRQLELKNDEIVEIKADFKSIKVIKAHDPKLYHRFMAVLNQKELDVFLDSLLVCYVGYLCANSSKILNKEKVYSEEEFEELAPFDILTLNDIAGSLITADKKK